MKGVINMKIEDLRDYTVEDFERQMFFGAAPVRLISLFIEEMFMDERIKEFLTDLIRCQLRYLERHDDKSLTMLKNSEIDINTLLNNLQSGEKLTYQSWTEYKIIVKSTYMYDIKPDTNLFELYTLMQMIKKQNINKELTNENK